MMIVKNRLIVTGTPKSGKTTFLDSISDTELSISNIFESGDGSSSSNPVTLDYGELYIDTDRKLEIYASPGQRKFRAIWQTLSRKALGLVIILDHRRSDPLGDLDIYLDNFSGIIPAASTLIVLNYMDPDNGPRLADFSAKCKIKAGIGIPAVAADPRNEDEAFYSLAVLLAGLA